MTDIDWAELRARARAVAANAYAPYSRLHVGAAALLKDGRIVTGCNLENASFGLTVCAEVGLVQALQASGGGHLVALAARSSTGEQLMPCGRCRQILHELGGPQLLIDGPEGPVTMAELLPHAFGPEGLP